MYDTSTTRILLIDDHVGLGHMIKERLEPLYQVEFAITLSQAKHILKTQPIHFIILDLTLTDGDGLDFCKTLRSSSPYNHIPILILSARGDPLDRVIGLETGADDYLAKPFESIELIARIKALLRRAKQGTNINHMLVSGDIELNLDSREAYINGAPLTLTALQFDLLAIFIRHAGYVLSRDQLILELHEHAESKQTLQRTIDSHVSKIRNLIEVNPKAPKRILTLRDVGYMFSKSSTS